MKSRPAAGPACAGTEMRWGVPRGTGDFEARERDSITPSAGRSSAPARAADMGGHRVRSARPAGGVRIIGGAWKRRIVPVVEAAGLRPTPNRVRETLFNWLAHAFDGDLSGRSALDLFAGCGALGFEAASRGASRVVMIDRDPAVVAQLRLTGDSLGARQIDFLAGDALPLARRMSEGTERFDVVFLDPPFGNGLLALALPVAARLLASNGMVYAEAERRLTDEALEALDLAIHRADKAGEVFYHLLRRNIKER